MGLAARLARGRARTASGLWGRLDVRNPRELSRAVQGGYHFWLLYFYDRVPIPHPERVIDSCLATQNVCGTARALLKSTLTQRSGPRSNRL